jgi:hypothetical protein
MLVTYSRVNAWALTGWIHLTILCCLPTIFAIALWWCMDFLFVIFAYAAFAIERFNILCWSTVICGYPLPSLSRQEKHLICRPLLESWGYPEFFKCIHRMIGLGQGWVRMSNLIACHRRWRCGDYRCDSSNSSLEIVFIMLGQCFLKNHIWQVCWNQWSSFIYLAME